MDLDDVGVFVGVEMAKGEHYVQAIIIDGTELFDRAVNNDQAAIETMIDQAAGVGPVAVVIDMTASGAQLFLAVAVEREIPVAYVTGLQLRPHPRHAQDRHPLPTQPPPRSPDCRLTARQEHPPGGGRVDRAQHPVAN